MSARVLLVTHNYPRFPADSAGAFVARLAEDLLERGLEVRVLTPAFGDAADHDSGPPAVRRFAYARPAARRIGYTGDPRSVWLDPRRLAVLPSYLRAFRAAVREECARFRPDVIHAHWWLPSGWAAAGSPAPLVITCHGSDVRLLARRTPMRALARWTFRRAAMVTTVSEFLRAGVTRVAPERGDRITVARMGVDLDRFAEGRGERKADPPRVLYAGYLVPEKGVDHLIHAFAHLRERGVRAKLRILGNGPALGELSALTRRLALTDTVEWSPLVPQDHMPAEYGAATVTVLPSAGGREGLGLALVEALAAGSAVIGTPSGGIPEVVVDGVTGLLVPEGDSTALAAGLERLLGDPRLREALTSQGRQHVVERWGREACVRRFLEVYRRAAPGAALPEDAP